MPGLSVIDRDVPAVPSWGLPPRPVEPPEFVQHVTSDQLRQAVQATLADLPRHRAQARNMRDRTFANLGSSAEAIISLIGTRQGSPDSSAPLA